MSKRELLCRTISRTGMDKLGPLFNKVKPSLKILAYHRILDDDLKSYRFDSELISANSQQFEKQVSYLSKHFNVVTLRDAFENLNPNGRENIVITFDDGFDDLYHKAYPILKKYNAKATMFISTGYMGSGKYLWTDELTFHLKQNLDKKLSLPPYFDDEAVGGKSGSCDDILGKIFRIMKQVPDRERHELLATIFSQLPIEPGSDAGNHMVAWEMVKEMSDYGIEFGSHTVNHPILTRLEGNQLKYELEESKRAIEEHTGKPCVSIAYPVGGAESFDIRVSKMVESLGYSIGCSYISGENPLNSLEPFGLRRLHVEHYTSFDQFKAQIAFAELCGYSTGG